jgi:hypothetical protein
MTEIDVHVFLGIDLPATRLQFQRHREIREIFHVIRYAYCSNLIFSLI